MMIMCKVTRGRLPTWYRDQTPRMAQAIWAASGWQLIRVRLLAVTNPSHLQQMLMVLLSRILDSLCLQATQQNSSDHVSM